MIEDPRRLKTPSAASSESHQQQTIFRPPFPFQKMQYLSIVRFSALRFWHSPNRQARFSWLLGLVLFALLSPAHAKYAAIVIDADSGRILHEKNADTLRYPASLTKMMTLYMVFSALENKEITLDTHWKVSAAASRQPPTKLGLGRGQKISVRDSILALVTKSANDIAVVVAEGLAGSESRFAQKMTAKALELGMSRTTFRNASGLPNRQQTTTARDIAKLALALMRDFPEQYEYFSTRAFRYGRRVYYNHNDLLSSYQGMDGIKTGYIRASGYNLAASAVREGRRLVAVVLGGRTSWSRNKQVVSLLNQGFARLAKDHLESPQAPSKGPFLQVSLRNGQPTPNPTPTEEPPSTDVPTLQNSKLKWGIQVGAFNLFRPAKSAAAQARVMAPKLLNRSRTVISPFLKDASYIYRARLIGIREHQAREACEILISKELSCIPVPPVSQQVNFTIR